MELEAGRRRSLWMPDDMWADVLVAVLNGRAASASAYVRDAVRDRLDRDRTPEPKEKDR